MSFCNSISELHDKKNIFANKIKEIYSVIRKKSLSCRRNRKANMNYGKTENSSGIPLECNF